MLKTWIDEHLNLVMDLIDGGFWTIRSNVHPYSIETNRGMLIYIDYKDGKLLFTEGVNRKFQNLYGTFQRTKIGVSIDKNPVIISKNINSRLIPSMVKNFDELSYKLKEYEKGKNLIDYWINRAKSTKIEIRDHNTDGYGSHVYFYGKSASGDMMLGRETSYMTLRSVPNDKMLEILKILNKE